MNTLTKQEGRVPNGATSEQRSYLLPPVNIFETKDGYVLEAEMPGVNKLGLEVTIEGSELTIVGRRSPDALATEPVYRESSPRDFKRVFDLDPAIDSLKIDAAIEQGVLTVHLPKAEKIKPRRIQVSG